MNLDALYTRPAFIPTNPEASLSGSLVVGMTGHRGVLGRLLSERLNKKGIIVDCFHGDIRSRHDLCGWLSKKKFDLFFHFAAVVPVEKVTRNPFDAFEVNSNGTLNVFSELYSAQPDCWSFFSSSSHVYSASNNLTGEEKLCEDAPLSPSSLYGMTKVSAEKAIDFVSMVHDIRVCVGRIFSFSHAEQKVPYLIPSLRERILRAVEQDRVEIINGGNIRDFLDAQVVVDVILALAAVRYNGKINVGSGIGRSVNSIANEISRSYKKRLHFIEKHNGLPNAIVADVDKLKASLKPLSKALANT